MDIVLDLPPPRSVNQSRRIDWTAFADGKAWQHAADQLVLLAKCRRPDPLRLQRIKCFELTVTMCEVQSRLDLDNGLKMLIDYLRRIEAIEDDSPKHMRKITVQWGDAPLGCRVTIKPLPS